MLNCKTALKRTRHPIPDFIRYALESRNLMIDYLARPPYQQSDYISWINQGVFEATRYKRIEQMLNELEAGGIYMKMPHQPSRK